MGPLSPNTEICGEPPGGAPSAAVNRFLTIVSAFRVRAAIAVAAAALCATVAGCSSDLASTTPKPEGSGQMRYFGGPKKPMWHDRVENKTFNSPGLNPVNDHPVRVGVTPSYPAMRPGVAIHSRSQNSLGGRQVFQNFNRVGSALPGV
jgi:hypothetical protein